MATRYKWLTPINPEVKNESSGTKLLNSWVESEQVILANNRNIHTRIDPHTGKGSTLDLALVSKNIETCVSQFRVDTDRKITPFSIRNIKGQVLKRHTDHLAITLSLNIIKRKELSLYVQKTEEFIVKNIQSVA